MVDIKKPSKSIKAQREKDQTKVRGIFRFYEVPGGKLSFSFKQYKEDGVKKYELIDNQTYELPLGVARHLNKNGWYPEHHFMTDEQGIPKKTFKKKIHRFGFQSLEFIDEEDLTQDSTGDVIFTPSEEVSELQV